MNLLNQSVGWLARNIPGSTEIFRQYQLDFCCGGNQILRDVLEQKQLSAEPIVSRLLNLQAQGSDERDWSLAPRTALIHHILTRYHDRHRQQLPEVLMMARKVEQVHRDNQACPHGLAAHLEWMAHELEAHMRKEELILFPMLQTHATARQVHAPIGVMRHEHDQHGEALRTLAELTCDYKPPRGACNTWRALYRNLEQLRDDLMQHIHLENNILFADAEDS